MPFESRNAVFMAEASSSVTGAHATVHEEGRNGAAATSSGVRTSINLTAARVCSSFKRSKADDVILSLWFALLASIGGDWDVLRQD